MTSTRQRFRDTVRLSGHLKTKDKDNANLSKNDNFKTLFDI
jgi:hypothetical protein